MRRYDYDCIIIGGGAAGLTAAFTCVGLGKRTAMIEKNKVGGECTWTGCIPSKTLIKAAKAYSIMKDSDYYGIRADGLKVDSKAVMERVRDTVEYIYEGETPERLREAGIDVFEGEALFEDEHTLGVGDKELTGEKIIICTGTRPRVPYIKGLDDIGVLTNESIFELDELPKSITIIGAGAIAIEMAQALNRLGTEVTVIQRSGRILKKEDEEMADRMLEHLESEGVRFLLGAEPLSVEEKLGHMVMSIRTPEGEETFETEAVFSAAGRVLDARGLSLEKAGVEYDNSGIKVDEYMRTSASNIYAAGDVAGPWRFSHMAYYQGMAAGRNASVPLKKKVDYSTVGWCLFTDPELAHLGVTESEATEIYGEKGYKVFRETYSELDRAVTDHEETGLVKVIVDRNGKIAGAHILGSRAGELIHELSIAMGMEKPLYKLNEIIHVYPTYSDILRKVALRAYVEKLEKQPILRQLKKVKAKKRKGNG